MPYDPGLDRDLRSAMQEALLLHPPAATGPVAILTTDPDAWESIAPPEATLIDIGEVLHAAPPINRDWREAEQRVIRAFHAAG